VPVVAPSGVRVPCLFITTVALVAGMDMTPKFKGVVLVIVIADTSSAPAVLPDNLTCATV
jgi:hypothetical protein